MEDGVILDPEGLVVLLVGQEQNIDIERVVIHIQLMEVPIVRDSTTNQQAVIRDLVL